MWNSNTHDCECNKTCKIDEYLDIKNYSCKKCLIGKLETLLNDKKGACAKSNCFIHTISLVIICLLYNLC